MHNLSLPGLRQPIVRGLTLSLSFLWYLKFKDKPDVYGAYDHQVILRIGTGSKTLNFKGGKEILEELDTIDASKLQ